MICGDFSMFWCILYEILIYMIIVVCLIVFFKIIYVI